jgi:hypothetical protein
MSHGNVPRETPGLLAKYERELKSLSVGSANARQ